MGRISTKSEKNIYQLCREACGLTREKASEMMEGISSARIEKIEYNLTEPSPYDILQMSRCYKKPGLCNYYCVHSCQIGSLYVPEAEEMELPNIVLETIASLNEINPLISKLIQITRNGAISDDEIIDFALISTKLDDISTAISSLNLWVEQTAALQSFNLQLFHDEKKKLKQ